MNLTIMTLEKKIADQKTKIEIAKNHLKTVDRQIREIGEKNNIDVDKIRDLLCDIDTFLMGS